MHGSGVLVGYLLPDVSGSVWGLLGLGLDRALNTFSLTRLRDHLVQGVFVLALRYLLCLSLHVFSRRYRLHSHAYFRSYQIVIFSPLSCIWSNKPWGIKPHVPFEWVGLFWKAVFDDGISRG